MSTSQMSADETTLPTHPSSRHRDSRRSRRRYHNRVPTSATGNTSANRASPATAGARATGNALRQRSRPTIAPRRQPSSSRVIKKSDRSMRRTGRQTVEKQPSRPGQQRARRQDQREPTARVHARLMAEPASRIGGVFLCPGIGQPRHVYTPGGACRELIVPGRAPRRPVAPRPASRRVCQPCRHQRTSDVRPARGLLA